MASLLEKYEDEFERGRSFDETEAEPLLDALIDSEDEARLASLFEAWNWKGIEEHEIYLLAKIMRERCIKVSSRHEKVVDIVGTGGSKVKTFNVSTAAAFVVAGAGVPIAKHGNKAATSNSGSADVLNELGIDHSASPSKVEKCLNEIGICFMFAPNHHRSSPTVAKVRRGLGFPTIFNCVGPLCNPAGAQHQLIGVWDESLVAKLANALARLGTGKSWVVHGRDGLDEISVSGPTIVAEVEHGKVRMFELQPEDLHCKRFEMDGIRCSTAKASAAAIKRVLAGGIKESASEALVSLNAAAAIYLSGRTDQSEGFETHRARAVNSIRNGSGLRKLKELAAATNK